MPPGLWLIGLAFFLLAGARRAVMSTVPAPDRPGTRGAVKGSKAAAGQARARSAAAQSLPVLPDTGTGLQPSASGSRGR